MKKLIVSLYLIIVSLCPLGTSPVYAYNITASVGYGLDQVGVDSSSDVAIVCPSGQTMVSSGGGTWACGTVGGSTPTGTGFVHINDGNQDAVARSVNLASSDVTGILSHTNGGNDLSTAPNNGWFPIGNAGTYTLGHLVSGTNVTINETGGAITINSTAAGSGGTVNVSEDGAAVVSADTLNFTTGLKATASGLKATVSGDMATTTTPGIASFDSTTFSVGPFGGVSVKSAGINLGTQVTGVLPIANGGTNQSTLTSSGFYHVNNGAFDTAARAVNLASSDVTGTLPAAIGGTGVATGFNHGFIPIGNGSGFTMASIVSGSGVTVTNTAGAITIAASGGGGSAMSRSIAQTGHGLAVQDVVRFDGTNYVKAKADSASTSDVVGVVSAVADADNFTLVIGGYVTTFSGLTSGSVYFLSDTTSGLLTTTGGRLIWAQLRV